MQWSSLRRSPGLSRHCNLIRPSLLLPLGSHVGHAVRRSPSHIMSQQGKYGVKPAATGCRLPSRPALV